MGYSGNFSGLTALTKVISFTIVNANVGSEQSVTIPGVVFGRDEIMRVDKLTNQDGLVLTGRVSADNTVKVRFANVTGSNITPTASDTYTFIVARHDSSLPTSLDI